MRYTYDINGALEVEITTVSTQTIERRTFLNESNLSEAEINSRFAALGNQAATPENRPKTALIARAERLYTEALGLAREAIKSLIVQFEAAIDDPHSRDKDTARRNFAVALDQFERSVF